MSSTRATRVNSSPNNKARKKRDNEENNFEKNNEPKDKNESQFGVFKTSIEKRYQKTDFFVFVVWLAADMNKRESTNLQKKKERLQVEIVMNKVMVGQKGKED